MAVVVDDEIVQQRVLERWLGAAGFDVRVADSGERALDLLRRVVPAVVFLDIELGGIDGLEVLARLRADMPGLAVVMLTVDQSVDSVKRALKSGAIDYLTKPIDRRTLIELATRCAQLPSGGDRQHGLTGTSPAISELRRRIDRVGPSPVTVVISGESGSGKELVARALHASSPRAAGPFVALNCAALPANLEASELFGHERGAFTGAERRRIGRLEQANQGTLFLDEVAELSPTLQASLLRALQERRFHRVGGAHEVDVDIRIVAASHADLREEVRAGRFREDLYYRLVVLELHVPALRERGDDVLALARELLEELAPGWSLDTTADAVLRGYSWPGNVRELRNILQAATVLQDGPALSANDLPDQLQNGEDDRSFLARELAAAGSVAALVDRLQVPRSTLYRRLKKHGLS